MCVYIYIYIYIKKDHMYHHINTVFIFGPIPLIAYSLPIQYMLARHFQRICCLENDVWMSLNSWQDKFARSYIWDNFPKVVLFSSQWQSYGNPIAIQGSYELLIIQNVYIYIYICKHNSFI